MYSFKSQSHYLIGTSAMKELMIMQLCQKIMFELSEILKKNYGIFPTVIQPLWKNIAYFGRLMPQL